MLEQRFQQTPDGSVWTASNFDRNFWNRYLDVFERVNIVARVERVAQVPNGWRLVNSERVEITELPYYIGPFQYLIKRQAVNKIVLQMLETEDAFMLRVPSPVASLTASRMIKAKRPYAVEVVGDPNDVFAPGSVSHPLRRYFRYWFTRSLKLDCRNATAAAYVTEHTLQQKYPAASTAFTTHYSSIELLPDAFVSDAKSLARQNSKITCIFVGTLAQLYKAPDVLLPAMKSCVDAGTDIHLHIAGDGKHRVELQHLARRLGIAEHVVFLGHLPAGEAVREQLDRADLFILPSRQEGLPRAMIEAMARGLPCIGSTVGGIPELLPAEDMVAPNDVEALARKVLEVTGDANRLAYMSSRNLAVSKRYSAHALRERRIAFYSHVRNANVEWQNRRVQG